MGGKLSLSQRLERDPQRWRWAQPWTGPGNLQHWPGVAKQPAEMHRRLALYLWQQKLSTCWLQLPRVGWRSSLIVRKSLFEENDVMEKRDNNVDRKGGCQICWRRVIIKFQRNQAWSVTLQCASQLGDKHRQGSSCAHAGSGMAVHRGYTEQHACSWKVICVLKTQQKKPTLLLPRD